MSYSVNIPDFAGSLARGEQMQASRLQALALQEQLADQRGQRALLAEVGPALVGSDPAARSSALQRLATNPSGLQMALPLVQQEQQRVRPMSPEERTQWGVRGTFAVDGLGRPVQVEASDMLSPGAVQQRIAIANASRAPSPPLIVPPGASVVGRDGRPMFTAPPRPESPFESGQGGAPQMIADLAPLVASGQATPQQQRQYALAVGLWQTQGAQVVERVNPDTNAIERVLVPRPLPEGFPPPVPFGQAVEPPTAGAQGAPFAPAARPAADPNVPRVINEAPPSPQAREAARVAEVGAGRVLDAINNFRQALEPFRGATGAAAFNPRSIEGQRLASAYELLKMAMRDESLLNTGVLQPGENVMIEQMLRSPTSLTGVLASVDASNTMLDEFAGFVQRGTNRVRGAARLPDIDWSQPRQGTTADPRRPVQIPGPGGRGTAEPPPRVPPPPPGFEIIR